MALLGGQGPQGTRSKDLNPKPLATLPNCLNLGRPDVLGRETRGDVEGSQLVGWARVGLARNV